MSVLSKNRWLGLFFLSLGVSLIIVDATIVNVAIPSLVIDLGIDATQAQWIQETYTLIFATFLLVFGRLADAFGRRRMFMIGAAVFGLSSVAAMAAASGNLLIAARSIQGLGGAMMLPTSLSLLNAMFVGKERRIAFAIWGSTIGGTAALGPLLGGWLTTDFSWRWAFGINIPLALIVIIGSLLHVTESRGEENSGRPDIIGALLSVVGVGSIVFALIEGRNYGWIRPRGEVIIAGYRWEAVSPSFAAFVVGAIAVIAFIIYELRRNRAGKLALLDLSLFSIASFRNGNIAAAIVSLGEFGLLFALPLFLQNVRVLSAFETGKILLALAIGSFVASGGAVQLTARLGAVMTVRVGIALEMIGVAAIGLTLSQRESLTPVIAALFVYGMGVGLATAQLTSVVLAEVPTERGGQASGTASTMRQLGSALGIAILGAVLFGTLTSDLTTRVEADKNLKPYLSEIVPRVENSAGSIVQAWRTNPKQAYVGNVAAESFLVATQRASYAGAAFLFVGLLATLRLRNVRTAKEEFVENESDDVPARTKGNSHGRVKKQPKSRSAR